MTISVSRRAVLKGTGAGFAASLFMHTAPTLAAETQAHSGDSEWTGYTICDSCNHMPMCGITFHAKGNTVIHIERIGRSIPITSFAQKASLRCSGSTTRIDCFIP